MKKKYGALIEIVSDKNGRKIHLFSNISKHIIKLHNKFTEWAKYWRDIIETATPQIRSNAVHYNKIADGLNFEIRVVKEGGIYLIKTAIMTKGPIIASFRRLRNV